MIKRIVGKLHQNKLLMRIFPTLDYCLQNALKDCATVLDLGCGPSSPLQYCKNVKRSVGVEAFEPYLVESKKKNIHSEYLNKKIEDLDFSDNSFDAVIMIEVLEHLPEELGFEILKKAEKWARKKIIVSSPNGFISQKELDNNPLQKHLSGWSFEKMKNGGFEVKGLAGFKFLRREVQDDIMGDDLLTSIKFKPRVFWFLIATISQLFVYFYPKLAFELFSIKHKR